MQTQLKLDLDAAARQIITAAKAEAVLVARDAEEASRNRALELTGELLNRHRSQIATNTADRLTVAVSAGPAINPVTGEDYSIPMHDGLLLTSRPDNLDPVSSAKIAGSQSPLPACNSALVKRLGDKMKGSSLYKLNS